MARHAAARVHVTRAVLLHRVHLGESDSMLQLFTERVGRVSAVARSARRSQRRFGALEPFHTLRVRLEERDGREVMTLVEATLEVPRHGLISNLDRMVAGGTTLGWVRRCAPAQVEEPEIWALLVAALDDLDLAHSPPDTERILATTGLKLLAACGWGLEFTHCVVCGRDCPPGRRAAIDPARGGLVCQSCGGAKLQIDAEARQQLAASTSHLGANLDPGLVATAMQLVEQAMRSHLGIQ